MRVRSSRPLRLATLILALALASVTGQAAETLRVAKPEATTFAFAFLEIGMKEGIFAKHGLEIESLTLPGAAKAHQAVIAGSADIELGSGIELVYIAKGSPAKGVAVLAGPPLGFSIMVRNDGAIKSVADLKGKLIGMSTVGSLSDWLPTEVSRREGWGGEGIKRIGLGSQDALSAALISGNVDGIIGGLQTGYRLEETGKGKILSTFGPLIPDFITHMIVATDSLIAARPDALRQFLAGWFETVRFAKTNKEAAVRDTMPLTRLPPEAAARLYDEQIAMFSDDGRFEPKALGVIKAAIKELGPLDQVPADSALFTEAFLPSAALAR